MNKWNQMSMMNYVMNMMVVVKAMLLLTKIRNFNRSRASSYGFLMSGAFNSRVMHWLCEILRAVSSLHEIKMMNARCNGRFIRFYVHSNMRI